MQNAHCRRLVFVFLLLPAGCGSPPLPTYEGKQGFKFTPPPGWVERDREDLLAKAGNRKPPDMPLPPFDAAMNEKLLVRYDRVSAGHLGWLRISIADAAKDAPLQDLVALRSPGPDWKREAEPEEVQVARTPAARIAFLGRFDDQDYLCETVAVRHGTQVYFMTASFPAQDAKAREETRKAIAAASWK